MQGSQVAVVDTSGIKQRIACLFTATRLTQIRLRHRHGSCDYTKGKQTLHVLLANRHVNSPALEEKQQLFLGLSKAAPVPFLLRAH